MEYRFIQNHESRIFGSGSIYPQEIDPEKKLAYISDPDPPILNVSLWALGVVGFCTFAGLRDAHGIPVSLIVAVVAGLVAGGILFLFLLIKYEEEKVLFFADGVVTVRTYLVNSHDFELLPWSCIVKLELGPTVEILTDGRHVERACAVRRAEPAALRSLYDQLLVLQHQGKIPASVRIERGR